ncbi:RHS repeat-associated core domain-containing protein, partial [Leptospira gomenensis]|uniref:RHS repeat-associated core domain-containing protein n=1 Tax=Leptospira gomenensis TaxID=2484974 RepID=UPI001AEFFAC9
MTPIKNFLFRSLPLVESSIPQTLPKPNVDSSGKVSFSIPISVPPGAGDVVPNLSLSYHSSQGNSFLGKGFSLGGIPSIRLNSAFGFLGNTDRFVSDLGGELLPLSGGNFAFKSDSSLRVRKVADGSWTIEDKNGVQFRFGTSSNSKLFASAPDAAVVTTWGLSQVRDRFGNGYDVVYDATGLSFGVLLPSSISYARGNARIAFSYSSQYAGYISLFFQSASKSTFNRFLSGIDVFALDADGSEVLTDEYSFSFVRDNGSFLLSRLDRDHYDPISFDYTANSNGVLASASMIRSATDVFALTFRSIQEGLQGAYDAGVLACACTADAGCMATVGPSAIALCNSSIENVWDTHVNGVETSFAGALDLNGDGIVEYVRILGSKDDQRFYVTNLKNAANASSSSIPSSSVAVGPVLNLTTQGRIFPGDFNGDGAADFLYFEKPGNPLRVLWGPNLNSTFVNGVNGVVSNNADRRGRHFVADMNGDGRSDFIQADAALGLDVYLSTGSNFVYSQKLLFSDFGLEFQLFADLDRNGVPDFIRIDGLPGSRRLIVTFLKVNPSTQLVSESGEDVYVYEHSGVLIGNSFGSSGNQFLSDLNGDGYLDFSTISNSGTPFTGSYFHSFFFNGKNFVAGNSNVSIGDVVPQEEAAFPFLPGSYGYADYDINQDGRMDRVSRFNEVGYLVELKEADGSFSAPISVYPDFDTLIDLNEDGVADKIRVGTFLFIVQIQVRFGPDDSLIWTDMDNNRMTIPPPWPWEVTALSEKAYRNWKNKKDFVDLNGDGRPDFVYFQDNSVRVLFSKLDANGRPFFSSSPDRVWPSNGFLQAADLNGDGRPELIGVHSSPQSYSGSVPSPVPGVFSKLIRQVPYASASTLEILRFDESIPQGLVAAIHQGSSSSRFQSIRFEYESKLSNLNSQPAAQRIKSSAVSPAVANVFPFLAPDFVVKSIGVSGFAAGVEFPLSNTSYSFSTPRYVRGGYKKSAMLGFESMRAYDSMTDTTTVQEFGSADPDLAGSATSTLVSKSGVPIHLTTQNFLKSTLASGSVWVRLGSSVETFYRSGSAFQSVSSIFSYDANRNPTGKSTSIGGSTVVDWTSFQEDDPFLFKPKTVLRTRDGVVTSRKEFDFNGDSVSKVREKLDATSGVFSESEFLLYDSFGNPTMVKDIQGNVTTIEYDPVVHKFPIRSVNSLGHVTEKKFDLARGLEIESKDVNGNITFTKYDSFGRVIAVRLPGADDWNKTIEYFNTGSLVDARVKTFFDADDNSSSWSEEILNLKDGLTTKRGSLSGGVVLSESTYKDKAGKVLRKIAPHIEGGEVLEETTFTYDDNQDLILESSNTGIESSYVYGANSTTKVTKSGSTTIATLVELKNSLGQTISKTMNGKTTQYEYDDYGNVSKVIDFENGTTHISSNLAGKQTGVSNPNTGTIAYSYDASGRLVRESYANGSRVDFVYDVLGRMTTKTATKSDGSFHIQSFEYDGSVYPNGKGRLTKVTDELGTTEFGYDERGNQTILKKTLIQDEGLVLIVEKKFNLLNKLTEITYPEGTKVHNHYSESGYLAGVSLTPNDGSSSDHGLVQYRGPIVEGGRVKVLRELGNGVWTDIYIDKISKRPLQTVTKKTDQVYENITYLYDLKGNISNLTDELTSARSQSFTYDDLNRLVTATGKYGTETYVYSDSGRLIQKGDKTFTYGDSGHRNAVTHVSSPGYVGDYAYDASGNMISRNGSVLVYDGFQKLKQMVTTEQGTIDYGYDFTGTRIKKTKSVDGSKVITLGGLYEISYQPGFPVQHTLSFYGAGGERLGQWSSTTAVLRSEVSNTGSIWRIRDWNSKNFQNWKTSLYGASNGMYYKTIHKALEIRTYLRSEPMSILYLVSILLLLGICLAFLQKGTLTKAIQTQLFTPLTLTAMLTLVTNCNGFLPNEDGEAPWAMAPLLIPPGTPSVIGTPASPGSGVPTPGTPITGFLFFINDHLGSVTMALDGQGNRIGGGEWGGVSRVAYKPYGEINRSDSGGPDVFRYKYTGQEEDRETGLYYYKSRYYDPMIGRFTQADSIFDASRPNSQDLYMYVEGNPINHTDPSGHSVSWGAIAAMALPMFTLPAIAAAAVIGAVVATAAILAFTAALGAVSMIAAVAAAGVIGVGIAVLGLSSYIGTTLAASSLFVIPAA